MSEHSVCAAKLVVLSVDSGDPSPVMAHSMAQAPASSSSSMPSTTSSPNRAKVLGIFHGGGGGQVRQGRSQMEKVRHQAARKGALARARHLLMALSTALAPLHSVSVSFNSQSPAVAASSPANGFKWSHGKSTLSESLVSRASAI